MSGPVGWFDRLFPDRAPAAAGDFSTTRRVIPLAALAAAIGAASGVIALVLTRLIALCTNAFFFQRLSAAAASPRDHALGPWSALVPVAGGLLIGLMARFGSERIRGHGIPEALEAILIRGSRVEPRLAVLKPLSAAISIGSGGPFGAEGPIIMTGGAFGSLVAQHLHLTAAERKTLLVAGAAAGMTATFGSPLAAMLLAVELLLFEWKPRSIVPVALACAAAMVVRQRIIQEGPLFAAPLHAAIPCTLPVLAACVVAGLAAGALSSLMTASVYLFEDLFLRHARRLHWMWWPAIGGVVIGAGGLVCPRALGIGFDSIGALLDGSLPLRVTLVLILVKWTIWSFALGSGTSGGVVAPLLMLGAALGSLEAHVFPSVGAPLWPLVGMGAILGGTMRAPFTAILFAAEVTHDWGALLPIAIAVAIAHAFTVLALRRSILTEKVARNGYHVCREYAIDPLEVLFVRDVMRPVSGGGAPGPGFAELDETLRAVAYRMAATEVTHLRVRASAGAERVAGEIHLADLLVARRRHLEEETRRERVIAVERLLPAALRRG